MRGVQGKPRSVRGSGAANPFLGALEVRRGELRAGGVSPTGVEVP